MAPRLPAATDPQEGLLEEGAEGRPRGRAGGLLEWRPGHRRDLSHGTRSGMQFRPGGVSDVRQQDGAVQLAEHVYDRRMPEGLCSNPSRRTDGRYLGFVLPA